MNVSVAASPESLPGSPAFDRFERMARQLETSGRYRILRKIELETRTFSIPDCKTRRAVFVDVETTGVDVASDEVIELAMVAFDYDERGHVRSVHPPFSALRDPGRPIPAEVTALTGLTDEMVAGHAIDEQEVRSFLEQAVLIVAHNAAFDRKFCERLCGAFTDLAWACSLNEVPWREEGFEGARLIHLAHGHGLFFDGHRAVHDCHAGIEILSRPLPRRGRTGLDVLLESARTARWRIWATNSPFEMKDVLKRRGYRWNDGSDGRPKAWHTDVAEDKLETESEFLRSEIYRQPDAEILSRRMTAYDRYSDRV
jgi:DNA polymerase-3 subunit epsilon